MAYISADGSIKPSREQPSCRPEWRAIALVLVVAIFVCKCWQSENPLSGGAIPAAAKMPHEHWMTISTDLLFVRTMTENLVKVNQRKAGSAAALQAERNSEIFERMELVDFGGPDGHRAERLDYADLESIRVTRCSTSQSAVTAYFCGAKVAGNQDVALGNLKKGFHHGVQQFAEFITCRHQQGERNHRHHRRSVYRLNIYCKDNKAGYSHAFNIVAQPDGSFFWLQSFIGHYSLTNWMSKVNTTPNDSPRPYGHLSLANLQAKLKQLDRLMNISGWSSQANADYLELFGVDKEEEAWKRSKALNWNPAHRLQTFTWDEACEYPLPPQQNQPGGEEGTTERTATGDECIVAYGRNMLEELLELYGGEGGDHLVDGALD